MKMEVETYLDSTGFVDKLIRLRLLAWIEKFPQRPIKIANKSSFIVDGKVSTGEYYKYFIVIIRPSV